MTSRGEDSDDPEDTAFEDDDMFAHRERHGGERARSQRPRVVSDFVRRAIENTVGSVSNTGSMSRDALNYLLQQGDRGRREIMRIVAHEVGDFLRGIDLSGEVVKVLENIQIDVNASVRFKPTKDGSVKAELSKDSSVNVVL